MPTVLVTGANRGIGAAACEAFRERGFRVLGTARTDETLHALKERGVEPVRLDLLDPASIAACAAEVEALGGCDVLVSNAGIVELGPAAGLEPEAWQRSFQVNVAGPMDLLARLVPGMRARGGGRVLLVGSVMGRMPGPFAAPYAASKRALEACADALRVELAPFGIHVSLVAPAGVDTGFTRAALPALAPRARKGGYGDVRRAERVIDRLTRGIAPERVAAILVEEATRPGRPRPRRVIGRPARWLLLFLNWVPARTRDRFAARLLGLPARLR